MFLYELAIELGERSNDVADVARMLGLADAGPASTLAPDQVAQLRAHFGGPALAPPPPGQPDPSSAVGPVAPASGPMAPAAWGPPPGTPTFEPVPGPPVGAAPLDGTEPGPLAVAEPGAGRRWSTGQLSAIVGVAVVVIGLFGFMVLNTGPDEKRQAALEERERELAAATTEWVPPSEVPTTAEAPLPTAAPMPRAAPGGLTAGDAPQPNSGETPPPPGDLTRFCSGMRAIMGFENAGIAAIDSGDIEEMRAAVVRHRADWSLGVDQMLAGASDRDRPLIESYREVYQTMFGAIERSASIIEVFEFMDRTYTREEAQVVHPVNDTAAAYCT